MKLIKRYSNRKLYDTERSCYVTLDEIAQMVRANEELQIIDNRTGEDLTTVTLAQIVLDEEKRSRKLLPLQSLQLMIRSPAEFIARISKPVTDLRDEGQRQIDWLRQKTSPEELRQPLREFMDNFQKTIDEVQRTFDERLRSTFDDLTHIPQLATQLERLEQRLAEAEAQIRRLRERLVGTELLQADAAAEQGSEEPQAAAQEEAPADIADAAAAEASGIGASTAPSDK